MVQYGMTNSLDLHELSELSPARKPEKYAVQPLVRAIAVLRYIGAGNRCRNLSFAAKATGVNRTTMIRILATLERERLIEVMPEGGGYRLGTSLLSLAAEALSARSIVETARPALRRLVEELTLSAHLGIREGTDVVYLAREAPVSHLASTVHEGTRLPAHATTIGRILLAELGPEELAQLYAGRVLQAFSERTATTMADLSAQLARDRLQNLSWSVGNFEPEIGSAAAAVFDSSGKAIAGINVTGPVAAFATGTLQAARIAAAVGAAAAAVSLAMGYRPKDAAPV